MIIEDSLPSTQTLVVGKARAGAPDGFAVLARRQTAGRGRGGRGWDSPAGNLHLSVLLRPAAPIREAPRWALVAGVALAETLAPFLPDPAALRLKWPNDLMLDGAKLAGILAEAEADSAGDIAHVVLGIGANLAHAPALPDRPTACLPPPPPSPELVAARFLDGLAHWRRAEFAQVRAAWLARGPAHGAVLPDGRFAGLSPDGALLVTVDGTLRTVLVSGDARP